MADLSTSGGQAPGLGIARPTGAGTFVRQATGLVRQASTLDTFIYNTNNQNIGIGVAFMILFMPAFYAGSSMAWATLIACALSLGMSTVYAFFVAAMPRSGGDYVYISRTLGPIWGFISSWNWLAWMSAYIGIPAAYFAQYGLAGLFRLLGAATGNTSLVHLGDAVYTPWGIFISGTLLIVVFALIFSLGVRTYFRIQNICFIIAMVSLVVAVLVSLFTTHATFVSQFDRYIAAIGGPHHAYNTVLTSSHYAPAPFSWKETLLASTWPLFIVLYSITSSFIGAEIKNARRSQFISMPVSVLYTTGWMLLLVLLVERVTGYNFLGAIGSLTAGQLAPLKLSFIPTYNELVGATVFHNLLLVLLLGVGFIFWTYVWLPINFLASTRILLAWALDRLLPERVAYVSERYHTPIVSIMIVAILGEISLVLYVLNILTTISGIFGWVLSFVLVSVAAILFPYRLPDVFEGSPVNWRFAGLPVITLVGVVSLISMIIVEVLYWIDPVIGVALSPLFQRVTVGVIVSGALVYLGIKWLQAARGVRVERAFREIPPE